MKQDLDQLRRQLRGFAREREWEQFHSPKNLSMALAVEAGEILEIFQWLKEDESRRIGGEKLKDIEDELGDVLIYLVRLADSLSIPLLEAAFKKLEKNKAKYPISKARGNAKKYTEFDK